MNIPIQRVLAIIASHRRVAQPSTKAVLNEIIRTIALYQAAAEAIARGEEER